MGCLKSFTVWQQLSTRLRLGITTWRSFDSIKKLSSIHDAPEPDGFFPHIGGHLHLLDAEVVGGSQKVATVFEEEHDVVVVLVGQEFHVRRADPLLKLRLPFPVFEAAAKRKIDLLRERR